MDQDYTHITIVIDRSGSMSHLQKDTIGGFNQFLADQKKVPGKATMTLVQFDDQYQTDFNGIPIADVPALTPETYVPRGGTALLDALHKAIAETKEFINAMPEDKRPGRVITVVITDGEENQSREVKKADLKKEVEECETALWRFVFMGANLDSFGEAGSLGMRYAGSTLDYTPTADGVGSAYTALCSGVSLVRCMSYSASVDRNTAFFVDGTGQEPAR